MDIYVFFFNVIGWNWIGMDMHVFFMFFVGVGNGIPS